jgi:DNA-binding MurR/RpiR family transcriptional regulator
MITIFHAFSKFDIMGIMATIKTDDFTDANASCMLRVKAILPALKSAEKKIADYIISNSDEVISLSQQELVQKTGASTATINRFVARLGYTGLRDFKKALYEDIIKHTTIGLRSSNLDFLDVLSLSKGTSADDIRKNVYDLSFRILEDSRNILSAESLEKAADLILSAKNFVIIGTGFSGIIARYAYSRIVRIGIQCFFDEDSTMYRMRTSLLSKDDVLFAISSSGRSTVILDCVKIGKETGAEVISLTDYAISPLSRLATVNLFTTPRNVSRFMDIDMPLAIGQLFIIDALFMLCCVKKGESASDVYRKTKQSTDAEKVRKQDNRQ